MRKGDEYGKEGGEREGWRGGGGEGRAVRGAG